MKKITLVIALLLIGTTISFAKPKDVRFSLVLTEDEAKATPNKKFDYSSRQGQDPKPLFVSNEALLSKEDINAMIVVKKEDTKMKELPAIDFVFTEKGTEKLADVTEKNLTKSIALVVGDQVLSAPYIIYPMKNGHLMISSWKIATDDEAKKLVIDLGFEPVFKGQINKIKQR